MSINDLFGTNVFSDAVMKERLPKETYKSLKRTIEMGEPLEKTTAEVIANAMKDWAIEKGATHYTHWFQPMTGKTAEKHDSFISLTPDGRATMEFSGKELIQGEPDASSFPNGGLRATFEARGYTAWDPTSPAFLKEDSAGVTLCIPTAFYSYTGEALDKKTPLLRSMESISKQAMRVLKLFGETSSKKVITTVGAEQEYFLVDKKYYQARKDLIFTGRTLFGAMPPKGQELDDHYFGSIKERIANFMRELDVELWKLGVSAKTKHNEVAPAQFEVAPIFSTTNIATDHNQLMMEIIQKVAMRHDLVCLLHEKPFAGVNGSGKHNNWSLATDDGINLLNPGKTPEENARFLLFLSIIIAAVDEYAPLLRLSAANPGNDHRLGANEAPPAIISVFLGDKLTSIINQIEAGDLNIEKQVELLEVGVSTLPKLPKDSTDRNRTSPFAFTGNRFEFRMCPSSASIAGPNIVLNTIVSEYLRRVADELEKADDFNESLKKVMVRLIKDHKKIIFDGDGYSDDWIKEAARRGLPNLSSTVEAYTYFDKPEAVELFERHGVFTKGEIVSRKEIVFEEYAKIINIEGLTMSQMVKKQIIPACINYMTDVAESISKIKGVCPSVDVSVQEELVNKISKLLFDVRVKVADLNKAIEEAKGISNIESMAFAYREKVFPAMAELRKPCDELEKIVSEEAWPYPTYDELLFRV
ncbi:glutamine synthetase III family protein [Vallitalea guaymasensis]|uniref:Glutamine synthetase III n=1 Tax=Vallitalea guaymasensis TaxID=1185412 RepID=A0A8J8M8P1_9FIRM|nr:glutamine synthetase III [Vallitalea guaymasensis]QUH28323.1 glutamine synthetase III [Vallitalea guaymasensis]